MGGAVHGPKHKKRFSQPSNLIKYSPDVTHEKSGLSWAKALFAICTFQSCIDENDFT